MLVLPISLLWADLRGGAGATEGILSQVQIVRHRCLRRGARGTSAAPGCTRAGACKDGLGFGDINMLRVDDNYTHRPGDVAHAYPRPVAQQPQVEVIAPSCRPVPGPISQPPCLSLRSSCAPSSRGYYARCLECLHWFKVAVMHHHSTILASISPVSANMCVKCAGDCPLSACMHLPLCAFISQSARVNLGTRVAMFLKCRSKNSRVNLPPNCDRLS